jgi:hypothetical protein
MHYISTQSITVSPNTNSLIPEVLFGVHAKHSTKYLPIDISGNLSGTDGKIIGRVYQQLSNGSQQILYAMGIAEKEITPYYYFSCVLHESALEYIEDLRQKNQKRDIYLKLRLHFKVLESKIPSNLAGVTTIQLEMEVKELLIDIVIPSSDWAHDFLPAFGKGKYLVLEIPQPNIINGSTFILKKLNEAVDSIPRMQKDLLSGEWSGVIKESRPIWELVNDKTSKDLHGYLSQSGFSDEAIAHFTKSISELFEFSSKFIHKVDKSKENLNPNIIASKEDAYLIYSLCVNVVNLITCKIKKLSD